MDEAKSQKIEFTLAGSLFECYQPYRRRADYLTAEKEIRLHNELVAPLADQVINPQLSSFGTNLPFSAPTPVWTLSGKPHRETHPGSGIDDDRAG